ncbi:MAG: hypothetical protein QW158_04660 [Nitrososphaerales archaeon]
MEIALELNDHATRLLLATQIYKQREIQDAKEAKERTKGKPITVVYMDIIFL